MLTSLSPTLLRVATPELEILPNTTIHYLLFTSHTIPMPAGVLKPVGWAQLTNNLENAEVISAILGIRQYGQGSDIMAIEARSQSTKTYRRQSTTQS